MRAAVVWAAGAGFTVHEDVSRRDPGPTDVVVRIEATGLCATDLALAGGAWGQPMPVVLGHEGAGVVVQTGDEVTSVSVGDHVVLCWIPPCGRCYFCRLGQAQLCSDRRSTRDRTDDAAALAVTGTSVHAGMGTATFAEETVVPERGVVRIAADVPFPVAAVLGCAVPTGVGAAVRSAAVGLGESVLVIGCGAVGLCAAHGAHLAGAATVAVCDPLADRRRLAHSLGATHDADGVAHLPDPTEGRGFDVCIDAVGSSATIRTAWDAVRRGGRVTVVGAGSLTDQVSFSAYEIFHEEKRLVGSLYGSMSLHRDLPFLVDLWRSGRLRLDWLTRDVCRLADIQQAADGQRAGEILRAVMVP